MGRVTARRPVIRVGADSGDGGKAAGARPDTLVVEEPLELRTRGTPISVTMRTPGNDFELASGFFAAEGVVSAAGHIESMRYCAGVDADGSNTYNVLDIAFAEGIEPPGASVRRTTTTTSACGLCGKESIDALRTLAPYDIAGDAVEISSATLTALPRAARASQRVFDRTGGLHAAALFTASGEMLCLREDVGRHNAVDKVVGWALAGGRLPARGRVLFVSGRASFELTQKALMAGIPALAAVSAPSSLAVDLATEYGMTLVGFLRGNSMNVYSGAHRIATDRATVPAD